MWTSFFIFACTCKNIEIKLCILEILAYFFACINFSILIFKYLSKNIFDFYVIVPLQKNPYSFYHILNGMFYI